MSTEAEKERRPVIKVIKSPDYKVVYTTGVFGGVNPVEGRMIFYLDRLVPGIKEGTPGVMEVESVERELQVEVHMSPLQFKSIAGWMQDHVKRMEETEKIRKKEEKEEK